MFEFHTSVRASLTIASSVGGMNVPHFSSPGAKGSPAMRSTADGFSDDGATSFAGVTFLHSGVGLESATDGDVSFISAYRSEIAKIALHALKVAATHRAAKRAEVSAT